MMIKPVFFPKSFGDNFEFITLPHPRNSKPNEYVLSEGKLYEVQLVDRPHSSWFLDNSVISDGSALFAHRVHPLFLAIPHLYSNMKEFQPIKDMFHGTSLKAIEKLIFPYLESVCTSIPTEFDTCYALEQKKMLDWLVGRIEKIIPVLRLKNPMDDIFLAEIGWGIVRHNLPNELANLLKEAIAERYPGSFPKKTLECMLSAPPPQETVDDVRKKTQPKKPKAPSVRPKGTADISSFFAPKK